MSGRAPSAKFYDLTKLVRLRTQRRDSTHKSLQGGVLAGNGPIAVIVASVALALHRLVDGYRSCAGTAMCLSFFLKIMTLWKTTKPLISQALHMVIYIMIQGKNWQLRTDPGKYSVLNYGGWAIIMSALESPPGSRIIPPADADAILHYPAHKLDDDLPSVTPRSAPIAGEWTEAIPEVLPRVRGPSLDCKFLFLHDSEPDCEVKE